MNWCLQEFLSIFRIFFIALSSRLVTTATTVTILAYISALLKSQELLRCAFWSTILFGVLYFPFILFIRSYAYIARFLDVSISVIFHVSCEC